MLQSRATSSPQLSTFDPRVQTFSYDTLEKFDFEISHHEAKIKVLQSDISIHRQATGIEIHALEKYRRKLSEIVAEFWQEVPPDDRGAREQRLDRFRNSESLISSCVQAIGTADLRSTLVEESIQEDIDVIQTKLQHLRQARETFLEDSRTLKSPRSPRSPRSDFTNFLRLSGNRLKLSNS